MYNGTKELKILYIGIDKFKDIVKIIMFPVLIYLPKF